MFSADWFHIPMKSHPRDLTPFLHDYLGFGTTVSLRLGVRTSTL